jgi:hypothetical protein
MLSIEFCDVETTVKMGDLFTELGFSTDTQPTDDSGDSYVHNEWSIEIRSLDGYYPIEGFRWTKQERQVELFHATTQVGVLEDCIPSIQCSPEHLIFRISDVDSGWIKVGNLRAGDLIVSRYGLRKVIEIQSNDVIERLCDIQVAIAHSYFTDNVLSHNSHFLTMLGAAALRRGINVMHYTFELSETQVGRRYDSNLCEIDSNDVIDSKEKILKTYDEFAKNNELGRLKIKYFPTNTASVYTLRSHMERLDLRGFTPGVVIIDYADIMRSSRQFDSLRHELKLVYEELRGLAGEKGFPIWTASQSNKEGSTAEIIDLGNMSEAYGKAFVADVVLSISRRAHEKSSGVGRMYIAKNRAGRDGIVYPVSIDTARSKFIVTGAEGSIEAAAAEEENGFKKALAEKWKELKSDPTLNYTKVDKKKDD